MYQVDTINPEDIIDLLPIVADQEWIVRKSGAIRNLVGECPACAVLNKISETRPSSTNIALSCQPLNILLRGLSLFVDAADYKTNTPMRREILQNLGLSV